MLPEVLIRSKVEPNYLVSYSLEYSEIRVRTRAVWMSTRLPALFPGLLTRSFARSTCNLSTRLTFTPL